MADAGLASAVPLPSSVTVIWLGKAANSALISTFAAGIANVVGLAVALFSSASPLTTVHFANEKFSLGVAVRVIVSPAVADAGVASAVPLPSSVTAVVYSFGSFVSSEQEVAVNVQTVAA